ncbi:Hypothetical predicted protein, partial [Paramuricea clavata]
IESLKWRKQSKIRDVKLENWLADNTKKEILEGEGILFYHNTDKKDNPILIFQGNKYEYKKEDNKEQVLEDLFAYLLEKQHQQRMGKQIMVICDHQNATLEHIDLKFFKFVVNLFNIYYPNILDSFLVVGVSWRVSSAWRNIQKWLSPDTSPKFKFVEQAQLTDYVDKSNLLVSLGGQDKYKYKFPHEEETQHPFEPSVNETGSSNDLDTQSPFEDAIEHSDDKIESIIPEELPPESVTLTTTSMGSSMATMQLRRRKGRDSQQSSIEEISSLDEESQPELTISPSEEITFQETVDAKEVRETLTLKNICGNKVIFKIKTNSAANFRVKPSMGALEPGSTQTVVVMLLLKGEATQEKHHWNKDKFLILYAEPQDEITSETSIHDVWKHTPKSSTREYKLNCRVLDVNGLEKRPKTIDDAIEMNIKLQRQMSQLQSKMENFTDPLQHIQEQLHQQRSFLVAVSIAFVILLSLMFWFR